MNAIGSKRSAQTGSARNAERHRLFEPAINPKITERERTVAKMREELARVLERLRAADVTPAWLRKRVAVLETEIAELSRKGGVNDASI